MLIKKLGLLVRFYPRSIREEFGEEIAADLQSMANDVRSANAYTRGRFLLREIIGWVQLMATGYFDQFLIVILQAIFSSGFINVEKEVLMGENGRWQIQDRRKATLAALPMVLFGFSITLTWWIIGGPWYETTKATLRIALIAGLAVAGLIFLGGVAAIMKRIPDWGFTWLGANIIGLLLLIKGVAEDMYLPIIDVIGTIIMLAAMILAAVLFFIAAIRSWQAAGLISIGMSTTMALANVHMMAIGPYHHVELAVLGLVLGLVFSVLTYFFNRAKPAVQGTILLIIGVLNIGITWLANTIWTAHLEKLVKTVPVKNSPFIPMVIILALMLIATPVAGIFGKFLKKYINIAK